MFSSPPIVIADSDDDAALPDGGAEEQGRPVRWSVVVGRSVESPADSSRPLASYVLTPARLVTTGGWL